ncbi:hypothetical protein Btru_062454 [Bulinus truncatus]|nr:hypothetical protein Btru_062454 [Bulinus truncatus]
MYKTKLKEDSTIASRRKSRGLERQKLRDDEVNRRRLLSNMSPVSEDLNDHLPGSKAQTKASRLDRLKHWKEERKKKQEEVKKNARKPMFKVSHLEYKNELQLFNKEVDKKAAKQTVKPIELCLNIAKPHTQPIQTKNLKPKEVKPVKMELTKEVVIERKTRASSKATQLEDKKQKTLEKLEPNREAVQKQIPKPINIKPQMKSDNLYCKLTAAAVAKATHEKHTNFLRAKKSHQVVMVKPKSNSKIVKADKMINEVAQEKMLVPLVKTPEMKKHVKLNTRARIAATSASESEQDLHLSDSTVSTPKHSTPRPVRASAGCKSSGRKNKYRKTPAMRKTRTSSRNRKAIPKRSVRDLSPIQKDLKKRQINSEEGERDSENETSTGETDGNVQEISPGKNLNISDVSDKENIKVYSPRLMRSALKKKSAFMSVESKSEENCVENGVKSHTPRKSDTEIPDTPTGSGKRRKSRGAALFSRLRSPITSPSEDEDRDSRSNVERKAKRARFTNLKSPHSDDVISLMTHDAQEPDPDLPKDESQNISVARKSLRLAALSAENDIPSSPEKAFTPKKRRSRHGSNRPRRSQPRRNSRSVVMSVSDEGTSGAMGENVIGEIHPSPQYQHKADVASMNLSSNTKVKSKASELIDISDEGTSLVSKLDPTVVYQVIKSEGSSRALQELTVAKIDGEISFIESLEDNAQSTQPFSPSKSNENSSSSSPLLPKAATSQVSTEAVLTPEATSAPYKSLRKRAYSVAPVFKTPGLSVSSKKSTKEKRRRKTDFILKSPEERVEILSKSPMIEMTRRRKSRLILDTAGTVDKESEPTSDNIVENVLPTPQPDSQVINDASKAEKLEKVHFYKQLIFSESERLTKLCETWTEHLKKQPCEIGEDVQGQIRSTVGKAQLLMDQRFKQFSGLINDCEFNIGEKETTPTDLQGFWEMIYCQVEDVDGLFNKLSELEKCNWQVKQPTPKYVPRKRTAAKAVKPKVKSNFAAFRQEMMKRKAKEPKESSLDTSIDMATVDSEVNKVFDAGFFKVSSPIKSYGGLASKHSSCVKPSDTEASSPSVPADNSHEELSKSVLKECTSTPCSVSNKENKVLLTPHNKILSTKRKSYLPTVPSPLLNDITGLKTKK